MPRQGRSSPLAPSQVAHTQPRIAETPLIQRPAAGGSQPDQGRIHRIEAEFAVGGIPRNPPLATRSAVAIANGLVRIDAAAIPLVDFLQGPAVAYADSPRAAASVGFSGIDDLAPGPRRHGRSTGTLPLSSNRVLTDDPAATVGAQQPGARPDADGQQAAVGFGDQAVGRVGRRTR